MYYITEAKPFTPAEALVASALLTSQDNKTIASTLGITIRTVKAHSASIYIKTNTINRIELMAQHIRNLSNFKVPTSHKLIPANS